MKEEWLDRLRTRLHGECGEEAPRGLLDDIRKEMERRGTAPVRPVRQKAMTVPMWIRRTASAAAVVAMVLYIGSRFGGQSPVSPQTDGRTAAVPARPGQTDPAVRHPAGARTAMSGGMPEQASAYGLFASLSYSGEKGAASCGSSRLREDREQGEATAATAVRPPQPDSGTEQPGGTDSGLPAAVQLAGAHTIHKYNENYYVVARPGDTFKSLGKELDISSHKLARYNERKKKDRLVAGEFVWLKKKRRKAPRNFKHHPYYVRKSESLYDIAQKYGIRLKSLVKKNEKIAERGLRMGDEVRLY